jgi:hypothetical protein
MLTDPAWAQDVTESPDAGRWYLGPIAVAPTLELRRLGFDTNVFNERDDAKRDFMGSVRTELRTWGRIRQARLTGETSVDVDYYARYQDERAIGAAQRLRLDVPVNRLRPFISGFAANTREAPSPEIDLRVRRAQTETVAGAEVAATGKMFVAFWVTDTRLNYRDDTPVGAALQQALDNRTKRATTRIRYALTPATSVFVDSDVERSRFAFASQRDAQSVRLAPGVEFGRYAAVSGSARVGYRHSRQSATGESFFKGTFGSLDLTYTLKGATRFNAHIERDIQASFQATQNYYLLTDVTATVDRYIGGRWDVIGRIGRQRLRYGVNQRSDAAHQEWTDIIQQYGISGSFRLGGARRVAVDLDYFHRHSGLRLREFTGIRFGLSAIYPL